MHRQRTDELLEALTAGREQLIADELRRRSTAPPAAPAERPVRAPAHDAATPAPTAAPAPNARRELIDALRSRQALRRAILLHDILGPPKALERAD